MNDKMVAQAAWAKWLTDLEADNSPRWVAIADMPAHARITVRDAFFAGWNAREQQTCAPP